MRGLTTLILSALLVVVSSTTARATAGTLDPTFSGDGIQTAFKTGSLANAVAIDHAGRTVVVGQTTDDHVDVAVARFRPDGSSDPSFGGDGRVRIPLGTAAVAFDVAITGNDGLAIAGRRTKGTTEDSFVLRLALIDFGKLESANAIAVSDAGRIDVGGYVSNGNAERCALARLDPDGTLDMRFSGNGTRFLDISPGAEQVNDLVVLPRGDIVAAGPSEFGAQPRFTVFRVRADGATATGFGHDGVTRTDLGPGADVADAIARTGSGAFVLAGSAGNDGHRDWGLVRYLGDGSRDRTFGNDGIVILAWSAAPESADDLVPAGRRLVVAGRIHRSATGDDAAVVRLRAGGKLDDTFANGGIERIDVSGRTDAAHGLALQENGKVVLAGETWIAGSPRFLVARLRAG